MKNIKNNLLSILSSLILSSIIPFPAHSQTGPASVYMEELTWMEVQKRIQGGASIAIIPTGSTEQMGPHLVTGAHNAIARYAAGEIAKRLSNALVTPVIAYSPAGRIEPAEGHMQFPGTLSVSDRTYGLLVEEAARSLRQHGFRLICLIGDHAGSQSAMSEVARRLTHEWQTGGVVVAHVSDYFYNNGQAEWTDEMGIKTLNPKAHGGLINTSELMAIDAAGVRDTMRAARTERDYRTTGAMGDSTLATAEYGQRYLSLKIEAAVKQIQNAASRAQ